jgi:hypothetical protein
MKDEWGAGESGSPFAIRSLSCGLRACETGIHEETMEWMPGGLTLGPYCGIMVMLRRSVSVGDHGGRAPTQISVVNLLWEGHHVCIAPSLALGSASCLP